MHMNRWSSLTVKAVISGVVIGLSKVHKDEIQGIESFPFNVNISFLYNFDPVFLSFLRKAR